MLVDDRNVHDVKRDVKWIALFVGIIWAVFLADRVLPLEQFGLVPRTLHGLIGIAAMPFLHADLAHIMGNSVPLIVTLALLAGSRANSAQIVFLIAILAGVGLWLFGREARHIGASGLVFGLIAFHVFAGVFERRLIQILLSVVVGFMYAGTLFRGVLPMQPGVSWDGHLIGAGAGVLVALMVSKTLYQNPSTSNKDSKDPFDDMFNRRQ